MARIGESIGHFSVTGKIGEGGMGEVYRATDTKLNREVALKLLPEILASDRQRMTRFEREAQVLASLNHPNIAAIYGLEDSSSGKALVMELVEGEDLSERIARSPLPVEEALRIALQIAEALELAHEKGIIHRDLKPSNVKLTSDGAVKVLDFGLAKALEGEREGQPDLTKSPTLSLAATQAGIILGTAGYMSPEQARGKAADRRADIWSFGVVLYEMLTGRQAFYGETLSDTLAKVLERQPDWEALPESIPARVRNLLRRCLEKDVRNRLQSIGEARIAIERFLADPGTDESVAAAEISTAIPGRLKGSLAGAAVLLTLVTFAAGWFLRPQPPEPMPVHLDVGLWSSNPIPGDQAASVVISRDGRRLAFVSGTSAAQSGRLFVRPLNRLEPQFLEGTEGAYNPFFSPDGQWIGFVTIAELKKVSVTGGTPLTLCNVSQSRGASWGEGGLIALAPSPAGGLMKVSAAGGTLQPLTTLGEGELSHRWPQFLPGGSKVLFTSFSSNDRNEGRIEVVDVESGERTVLHQGGTYGRYAASGHLLFVNRGTLFAAELDLNSLTVAGIPAPVLQDLTSNGEGGCQFDLSENGTLVYLTGQSEGDSHRLFQFDLQGTETQISESPRDYRTVRLSPDGKRLAVDILSDGNVDVWLQDLSRDIQTRLTFHEGTDESPIWSADGQFVYYSSNREGKRGIFRKRADGSGQEERITESLRLQSPYSVSSDGRYLALHEQGEKGGYDIRICDLEEDFKTELFFESAFTDGNPVFSPDGRWIAYTSDETGSWEVYVRPFPGPGGKWQISTAGGDLARWSRDGRHLYYLWENTLWKVAVEAGDASLEVSRPEELLVLDGAFQDEWDLSPDESRLFRVRLEKGGATGGPNLVKMAFSWFQDLDALLQVQ
ncbi:MAG: protein kinase [Acidobacteriota bacterium]|nr:MAG: protein kinase [Acidobacteriota bacterium]